MIPEFKIVDDIEGAEVGYRALVTEDGATVCNPSPMGEDVARLLSVAPNMRDALVELRRAGSNFRGWHAKYEPVIRRITQILDHIEQEQGQ